MKNSENMPLDIEVYNFNTKITRFLVIVPSRSWSGDGLLGIVIRLESYEDFTKDLQVFEVQTEGCYLLRFVIIT
jgi:hypothetical protein